jgi:quercetin dioxygenase-like cupin family protein
LPYEHALDTFGAMGPAAAETLVTPEELRRRTIYRRDFVSCNLAFIDCKTPGSEQKENYSMIGPGVTQSADQVVNLREPHGFNLGAAAMPNGVTNNLHLHFTAEVFFNVRGRWRMRWGVEGGDGEHELEPGDVLSIPAWIFRGFTNVGPDDGWLYVALGFDDTGGIIWAPSVLEEAASHGLYLSRDNELVDTTTGAPVPPAGERTVPLRADELARLRQFTPEEMAGRVCAEAELAWSATPFLCSGLPGGRAELALVIGFGMTEDRAQQPKLADPHNFNAAFLRAEAGEGVLTHRQQECQAVFVTSGRWRATLNAGPDALDVELAEDDILSVPPGAWRRFTAVEAGSRLAVVNGGDGRVRLDWHPEVAAGAVAAGQVLDAAGYVAPQVHFRGRDAR